MSYYFYFARCSDDSLYCGSCKNFVNREITHNSGKGAKYTRSRIPVKIIYTEKFPTLAEAMRRESQVKKWPKQKKEQLAKGNHPTKD